MPETDLHAFASDIRNILHGGRRPQAHVPRRRCVTRIVLQPRQYLHHNYHGSCSTPGDLATALACPPGADPGCGVVSPPLSIATRSTRRRISTGLPERSKMVGSGSGRGKSRGSKGGRIVGTPYARRRHANNVPTTGAEGTRSRQKKHESALVDNRFLRTQIEGFARKTRV